MSRVGKNVTASIVSVALIAVQTLPAAARCRCASSGAATESHSCCHASADAGAPASCCGVNTCRCDARGEIASSCGCDRDLQIPVAPQPPTERKLDVPQSLVTLTGDGLSHVPLAAEQTVAFSCGALRSAWSPQAILCVCQDARARFLCPQVNGCVFVNACSPLLPTTRRFPPAAFTGRVDCVASGKVREASGQRLHAMPRTLQ